MVHNTEEILNSLITAISELNKVQSIGISGSITPLPKAGQGDIDIFIYCDTIPEEKERLYMINELGNQLEDSKISVFEGGHFGVGDFVHINGIETWLMYFTVTDTLNNIGSILRGEYPDKLDNYYYPVGRCAMLNNINILYDKNDFLSCLKKRLCSYPYTLAKILIKHHLDELNDTEDLERAVIKKDVLFYHFAMDKAMDHFLQVLFAMNRAYFPSRKRSLDYINNFEIVPEGCSEKLLEVIKFGGYADGIQKSYILWQSLVDELKMLNPV